MLLEVNYASCSTMGLIFLFLLNIKTDHITISLYQTYIKSVIDKIKAVCFCCHFFILVEKLSILNIDSKLML